jgi:sulfate permease, SulP family
MSTLMPGLDRLARTSAVCCAVTCWPGGDGAAYLVPQVMAYVEIAGLPPVVGLFAIMGPLLVYAVIGSSRQLSVGPESTTALMTASVIALIAAMRAVFTAPTSSLSPLSTVSRALSI